MHKVARWTCFWPGLPQLWYAGSWTGLTFAVGFSLLVNLTLLGTFVWTEVVSGEIRAAAWLLLLTAWGVWVVSAWRWRKAAQTAPQIGGEDLFPAAIGEYLQGNWFEAESLLAQLIQRNPGDVEARLMQATLWRRTGRRGEANVALQQLLQTAGVGRWALEIQAELAKLAEPCDSSGRKAKEHGTSENRTSQYGASSPFQQAA